MSQSDLPLSFPIVRYIKPEKTDETLVPVVISLQNSNDDLAATISEFTPSVLKAALDSAAKRIIRGGREHGNAIFLEKFRLSYDSSPCNVKEMFQMNVKYSLTLGLRRGTSESPSPSSRLSTPQRLLTPESEASSPVRPRYVFQESSIKQEPGVEVVKAVMKQNVVENAIAENTSDQKPADISKSPEKKQKNSKEESTVVRADSASSANTADTIPIYPSLTEFTQEISTPPPAEKKQVFPPVSSLKNLTLGGRATRSKKSKSQPQVLPAADHPFADTTESTSTAEVPKLFSNLVNKNENKPTSSVRLFTSPGDSPKRRRDEEGGVYLTPKKRKFIIDQFMANHPGEKVPEALLVKRKVVVQRPSIFGSVVSGIQNLFTSEVNEEKI